MLNIWLLRFSIISLLTLFASKSYAQRTVLDELDAYIDARFDGDDKATKDLLSKMKNAGVSTPHEIEEALLAKRAKYPDTSVFVGKTSKHNVKCLHVDYESAFLMYLPKDFDDSRPVSVVVVGHGGNSSMSPDRAERTAQMYLRLYAPTMSKEMNAIFVAPISGRGWGHIGNSLIFSTISKVQRMFWVDPDRIYITGQSMGGHMSYRAALTLADRFGAVSPHSGGYDYVEKQQIANLINVPGYAIWGKTEPYGINTDNRTNQKWASEKGLDWKFVEKNGGHTIYVDELPSVAKFFNDHPRNLYRKSVYMRQGGAMKFVKTWGVKGWPEHKVYHESKPMRWNARHWLEIQPREDEELDGPLTIFAKNNGDNTFEITSQNVRNASIYLHPKMVDFDKQITVIANGETVFTGKVETDTALMLELVREFDDRGRVFWAKVDFEIKTDKDVPIEIVKQ